MSETELLELLGPRLKARADIPSDFLSVTFRIRMASESAIIKSMHTSMSSGPEFFVTIEGKNGGSVQFWKKRRARQERRCKGAVPTMVSGSATMPLPCDQTRQETPPGEFLEAFRSVAQD